MGRFIDRIMGKSLENGQRQGIIAQFRARREGNGNGEGKMFGGAIQQSIVDLRTSLHDAIEDMGQDDGILKKGLISNIIPHIRTIRIIPPPPEPEAAPATGMNIPAPLPAQTMQVPVEDTRPLTSGKKGRTALQQQVDDIRVLGGQYEINIS